MRITVPQEVQAAREILRERDRYISQAQEEAALIIAQAREEAARQVEQLNLKAAAEREAREIVRQAERDAHRIRAGADEYAEGELRELGQQVAQLMAVIRNGLEMLEKHRQEWQEESASPLSHGTTESPVVGDEGDGQREMDMVSGPRSARRG